MEGCRWGDSKYYLNGYEDKIRFLIWGSLGQELFRVGRGAEPQERYEAAVARCNEARSIIEVIAGLSESRQFTRQQYKKTERELRDVDKVYQFQEFVKSPTGLNTSFRVTVDAKGDVHYITIITSEFRRKEYDASNLGAHPWEALATDTHKTLTTSIFMDHPNSPTHITTYKVVSNRAKGGHPILLYNNSVERPQYNPEEEAIIAACGMDPKNPKLPDKVIDLSKRLAFGFRSGYPYSGVDFIQNQDRDYLFLEVNYGPDMNPRFLGMPEDSTPEECELELMRRVASKY